MTQQDIVFEIRRMLSDNSITWDDIKIDADRAIVRINAHLGADYPMMSDIMQYYLHKYTMIDSNGTEQHIFPKKYIYTVVLPYIASEVLAREEEFTTIYNKYVMDYENGLFDMFQNEYNRVPLAFRQDSDIGVFFSSDNPKHVIHKKRDDTLPEFTFRIYYHFNESEYPNETTFTFDDNKYGYDKQAYVKDSTVKSYINSIYYYSFRGWTKDPLDISTIIHPGDLIKNIKHDIHLYAVWNKICLLDVSNGNRLIANSDTISSLVFDNVRTLVIPEFINGKTFTHIPSSFSSVFKNLISLVLPRCNLTLEAGSLNITSLTDLVFPKYDYLHEKPKYILNSDCIKNTSVHQLYLPYSIEQIDTNAINNVPYIACEVDENNIPNKWYTGWYTGTDVTVRWGVIDG